MKKIIAAFLSMALLGCSSKIKNENAKVVLAGLNSDTETLHASWNELKARHLRLLPVPKSLKFTGQEIPVENIALVLSAKTEDGEIAVNEINSRVEELTGKKAPVLSSPAKDKYNVIIEDVWPNTFTKDEKRPEKSGETDQGYALYPEKNSIILAGQGTLGMMYSAVTLRWLIGVKNNKAFLYPAKIVDWPDFENRMLSSGYRFPYMENERGNPEKHLAEFRKYIDYLFRLKANRIGYHTYTPFQGAFSPLKKEPDVAPKVLESIRKVNDYARKRGIKAAIVVNESLGKHPYQKSPELDELFLMPWHNIYVSWARRDLHRRRARRVAEFCKAAGIFLVNVHSPDGGGIRDPEMWSHRGPLSKKMYPGNKDRAQADADVFNVYSEVLNKQGIETGFIQYSYSPGYLNADDVLGYLAMPDTPASRSIANKLIDKQKDWGEKLNSLIPLKHSFCLRENSRENMLEFYKLFKDRPFFIYYEVYNDRRNLNALLPKEISTLATSYSEDLPADSQIMVSNYQGFPEPVLACVAEYSWNVAFPGAAFLDRKKYTPGKYNASDQEIMAERAAVGLWGYETGAELRKVFDKLLSIDFAVRPFDAQKRLNLKNLYVMYRTNHEALLRAEKALDKTWLIIHGAQNKNLVMDKFSYPFFVQYYKMIKGALPYSIANLAAMNAEKQIRDGNFKEARKTIDSALKRIDQAEAEFKSVQSKMRNEPMVYAFQDIKSKYYRNLPKLAVLNPEVAKLKKQLDDLWRSRETIYNQNNMPEWFKAYLKKRSIIAVKCDENIKVDGDLSEKSWSGGGAVEYFIENSSMFRLCPQPLFVKILFDGKNLYCGGEIAQPLAEKINAAPHGADKYVPSESVELLIIPDENSLENMFQIILDSSGNLFTLRKIKTLPGEPPKREAGWNSRALKAVKREKGKWRFEMALPFEKLGVKPGKKWKCLIGYNREASLSPQKIMNYASCYVDGKGFHKPEFYSKMVFADKTPMTKRFINIKCSDIKMRNMLHTSGTGSLVSFAPELETTRPLCEVSVEAVFFDEKHKRIGNMKLKEIDYLPLFWKSRGAIEHQLENVHRGVVLKIIAKYKTVQGKKGEFSKSFVIGNCELPQDKVFIGNALAIPVCFDTLTKNGNKLFEMEKGGISFKFYPAEDLDTAAPRCLFHLGPLRKKYPENYNRSSVCAIINKNILSFMITNENYECRRVSARLPATGQKKCFELEFVWNLDSDGQTEMKILLDKKKISGPVKAWKNANGRKSMKAKSEAATMQIGSLNSGRFPAHGLFKDLRVSPEKGKELFFSFNDTLEGQWKYDGTNGVLKARTGFLFNR